MFCKLRGQIQKPTFFETSEIFKLTENDGYKGRKSYKNCKLKKTCKTRHTELDF